MDFKMTEKTQPIYQKRTWDEFQKSRLLWWVNRSLRLFGWSIALETKNGIIVDAYPVKTNATAYPEDFEIKAFEELQEYIKNENNLYP